MCPRKLNMADPYNNSVYVSTKKKRKKMMFILTIHDGDRRIYSTGRFSQPLKY